MAEQRAVQITIVSPTLAHPQSGSPAVQVSVLIGDIAAAWADTAFATDQLTDELLDLLGSALTAINNHQRARIAARLLSGGARRDRSRSRDRAAEDAD